jgi:hypothetical protein
MAKFVYKDGEFNIVYLDFYKNEYFDDFYFTKDYKYNYTNPEFEFFDEFLQNRFLVFFDDIGINPELASFLNVMKVDKDEKLYKEWLIKISDFI